MGEGRWLNRDALQVLKGFAALVARWWSLGKRISWFFIERSSLLDDGVGIEVEQSTS